MNFLALLGWNPGDDTEVMPMEELISKFSFDHCSKAGAKFAFEKGKWFNHMYLQNTDNLTLAQLFRPVLNTNGVDTSILSDEYIASIINLVKGRINFVNDLWGQTRFFFMAPTEYAPKDIKKRWSTETPRIMEELIVLLQSITDFSSASAEPVVINWITDHGYHMGNVMNAFRLAIVGECKGPHMFDITELLGKDETISRLRAAIGRITPAE